MSKKISNKLLKDIVALCEKDISLSISECAQLVGMKGPTLTAWRSNLRTKKWGPNYSKTEDGELLDPALVEKFINSFVFGENASKILKRLVLPKCLNDPICIGKQRKLLKRLVKKYPNINFWLYANLGEPREDMLLFLGKGEKALKKKYIDFSTTLSYTQYKRINVTSPPSSSKARNNPWDYYQ